MELYIYIYILCVIIVVRYIYIYYAYVITIFIRVIVCYSCDSQLSYPRIPCNLAGAHPRINHPMLHPK